MFAYIPARIGSKRIKQKNIRLLDGKPIICHVIEQLMRVPALTGIAVSTDSELIQACVSSYSKVTTLALRTADIADDQASFMDLIRNDLPRFEQHFGSHEVVFTLATAALITDNFFTQGIELYQQHTGLVMSVASLPTSVHLALEVNEQGSLAPLFPEKYPLPTAQLTPLYADAGGFYIFDTQQLRTKSMFIELNPIHPVPLPANIALDIDDEADWQLLEQQYAQLHSF